MTAPNHVVRLWNWSWLVSLVLGLGLALGVAVAADEELAVATKVFAILWLPIFLLSVPPLGPMFLKVPLSQPWLKISGDGLDYGGRIRVPWTAVSAIRPHKVAIVRRRRNSFVLPGWQPPGQRPAAFVENHVVIPDELQRSVEGLQELADPLTHDGALPGTPRHQSGELLADCRR